MNLEKDFSRLAWLDTREAFVFEVFLPLACDLATTVFDFVEAIVTEAVQRRRLARIPFSFVDLHIRIERRERRASLLWEPSTYKSAESVRRKEMVQRIGRSGEMSRIPGVWGRGDSKK